MQWQAWVLDTPATFFSALRVRQACCLFAITTVVSRRGCVKSLQLQAEMTEEFGACVFDVTLDCEDGAPVGGEA